jgi:peptide/histidine transporter 3/4
LFFSSLYLIAIAQGGHRPCTQAFGADQFDCQDPSESNAKSSFFNWWYFGVCAGSFVTKLIVVYVQDNFSWGLGFGIPCIMMLFGLLIFLLGAKAYRYVVFDNEKNPFSRIGRVFVATIRNRRAISSAMTKSDQSHSLIPHANSEQFK